MITYTDFQPSTEQVFSFQTTLDGQVYVCTITWNLFGQRYYINCLDLSGSRVFSLPLIGSPDGLLVETLSWAAGKVVLETILPHGYRAGATVNLTMDQTTPAAYGGRYNMLALDGHRLTYSLPQDPGPSTAQGILYDNINIAAGYFQSVLLFRASSSQFEVSP